MIGEAFTIKPEYAGLSHSIIEKLEAKELLAGQKIVIGVGGESGSGKSTTAISLQQELHKRGYNSQILHQDNFYQLPPADNHQKRVANINWVGTKEVDWKTLSKTIMAFRMGEKSVVAPIVSYEENQFSQGILDFSNTNILIAEGVYILELNDFDLSIFMQKTYHDTWEVRRQRKREKYDPFVEQVLEIEHQIIRAYHSKADFCVNTDYQLID